MVSRVALEDVEIERESTGSRQHGDGAADDGREGIGNVGGNHTDEDDTWPVRFVRPPGLVDAHSHLFLDAGPTPRETYLDSREGRRVAVALAGAERALAAGVTTIIDLGAWFDDIAGFRGGRGAPPAAAAAAVVWAGPPITRRGGPLPLLGRRGRVRGRCRRRNRRSRRR